MLKVLLSLQSLLVHSLLLAQLPLLVVFVVAFLLREDVSGPLSSLLDLAYRLHG